MNELERRVVDISFKFKLAHIGSSLTAVNIIDSIYGSKRNEDKFVLSSGHAGIGLYTVLEKYGFGDAEELFKQYGVHPLRDPKHDIWVSTGSLGHGIGIAVGMALADRSKNIYCLISDGECMEGSVWESMRIAEENKLNNIHFYFNFNGYGGIKEIDLQSLCNKINSFSIQKKIIFTNTEAFPGLLAHYIVLDKDTYEKLIR